MVAASASTSSFPPPSLLLPLPHHRISRQFFRRRPKWTAICIRSHQSDDFLHGFISHLPPPLNSLNSLPLTALGFASGLALSLPKLSFGQRSSRLGEWILFTSPTPFNQFVLLRCPTVSFEGGELLEDVNQKLVKEERHFVRLDSGRIPSQLTGRGGDDGERELEYSRVCVGMEDGGVIALDWPAHLDLNEEHGLDSTVLLVPGSAEGSMGQNVRDFVFQCLNRGLFPVVMNPRGCAGSPLTTPRLITAADSDDVSSAVQFLSRARPWSTFMAVGWGFGANMLTKYLAEVGEKTPLTAATCIDNPFDLEEVTRASNSGAAVNQKLTGGLIDILKLNKGLFQGRSKGFDVESALSAKSVREFDTAISMISYGFETIEEFYSMSSTRSIVGNIKVPVLYIQSDDQTVPPFSIPRGDFVENPFTSLLLCSSLPSNVASGGSVIMWFQELTIEWLMAVELALLKGRHPLLKDVDVNINPSKGLAIAEGWLSDSDEEPESVINPGKLDASNGYMLKPTTNMLPRDYNSGIQLARKGTFELQDGDYRQVSGVLPQSGSVNAEFDKQESADEVEGDKVQILQAAQVVMNMLDVTMPGTLKEEDKKKVLTAVEHGKTLVNALQDAVPEDVRGKLTTSVSEILQSRGKNLNLDAPSIGQVANMSSELKMKIDGNLKRKSDDRSGDRSIHSSETTSPCHDSSDYSSDNRAAENKSSGESDGIVPQEKSVKSFPPDDFQSISNEGSSDNRAAVNKSSGESDDIVSQEKSVKSFPPVDSQSINNESSSDNRAAVNRSSGESDNIVSQEKSVKSFPPDDSQLTNNEGSGDNRAAVNKSSGESDNIVSQEKSVQSFPLDESQSTNNLSSAWKGMDEAHNNHDCNESTMEEHALLPQSDDDGHAASTTTIPCEKPPGSEDVERGEQGTKENNEVKPPDSSKDTSKTGEPTIESEGGLQSHQNSPDSQLFEKQDGETKNVDESSMPVNLDENKPPSDTKAPTFNVSEALDVLTGLDDSTQVAVSSVFGVIEEMINQLEEKKDDDNKEKEGNENRGNNHLSSLENDNNVVENAANGNDPKEARSSLDILSVDENGNLSGLRSNTSGVSDDGMDQQSDKSAANKPVLQYPNRHAKINDLYLLMATKAYTEVVHNDYLQKFIQSNIKRGDKHFDLDTSSSLFLDYIPEEGYWKLLEQPANNMDVARQSEESKDMLKNKLCSSRGSNKDEIFESSYIIVDSDRQHGPVNDFEKMNKMTRGVLTRSNRLADLSRLVKNIVLDSLNVEVSRKLVGVDVEEMDAILARDVEEVANAVVFAVRHDAEHNWCLNSDIDCTLQQGSGFDGIHIIDTISSAVKSTNHLRRILPVGVVVGSSLASLRKFFNVASVRHDYQNEAWKLDGDDVERMNPRSQLVAREVAEVPALDAVDKRSYSNQPTPSVDPKPTIVETAGKSSEKSAGAGVLSRDTVTVGAVTAALGASALFQHQKERDEVYTSDETPSKSLENMRYPRNNHAVKLEEAADDKHQNMVISLAEKAMSVAAPVVPTKDGEVDQDRLVAMLAELGQKGGILKLAGKLALLWGGIRGAMSLTNRLLAFMQVAERPLIPRILAFGCMVLLLWSPVVVPFLPTFLQNWATKRSSMIAELVCTFGLYIALATLIVLWGKGIRGYENPLQQYGLDLPSSVKIKDLFIGLLGGVTLVLSIHAANASLGFVGLSWPSSFSSSPANYTVKFQFWLKLFFLAGQGLVTAISIAFVEELFFRSWLAQEIAIDLGDHRGVVLSGLAFSICQTSLQAIPGLWLLSLCLAGARQRKQGSLYTPIGLRAGIMTSCFVLQKGGFLIYRPNFPLWMTGTHPFQPFSGIVGLVFSLLLALVLYPREPSFGKEMPATIQE